MGNVKINAPHAQKQHFTAYPVQRGESKILLIVHVKMGSTQMNIMFANPVFIFVILALTLQNVSLVLKIELIRHAIAKLAHLIMELLSVHHVLTNAKHAIIPLIIA